MKPLVPAIVLALAAAPTFAFTPERAGMMVDALRANDCALAGAQAGAVLGPLGLAPVEVQSFVDILFAAELVTLSDDMEILSLVPALCETEGDAAMAMIVAAFENQETLLEPYMPNFEPARGAEFVAAVRANDCAMTDEEASAMLPPLGFDPETARDIVSVLFDAEVMSISEDGIRIQLSDALCAADPAGDVAVVEGALAAWNEVHAVEGGSE